MRSRSTFSVHLREHPPRPHDPVGADPLEEDGGAPSSNRSADCQSLPTLRRVPRLNRTESNSVEGMICALELWTAAHHLQCRRDHPMSWDL